MCANDHNRRSPCPISVFLAAGMALLAGCRFKNEDRQKHQERIVSLSKQYSEIIYALGANRDLVAVDLSSTYPPEIKSLPTVGYHRALSAEGIVAVKPTLILHDNNVGPEHVMRQLEQLKLPMRVFQPSAVDIASTKALIAEMGRYFHQEARAQSLNDKLDRDTAEAARRAVRYGSKPKVMIIHFGQAMNIYLTITRSSIAGKMIEWAGGEIPIGGDRGMVQLSPEVAASADPDVILLTDFGFDRLGSAQQVSALPGVAATRAAKRKRIHRVEEHDLVYFGPRTGENVLKLQELIHAGETTR